MTPPRVVAESRVLPVAPPSRTPPGRLILRVLVATDGRVADLEVLREPYGGEALKVAALAAVRGWRYAPAQRDGATVACWLVESVEFVPGMTTSTAPPAPGDAAPRPDRPPSAAPAEPVAAVPQDAVEASAPPVTDPVPAPTTTTAPPPEATPALPLSAPEPVPEARPAIASGDAPRPAPERAAPEPAIDLTRGGPPPLELGGSAQEAAAFLGADPAADPVRAAARGLEVTLVDRDGERRVASIRYLFADGREGFRASLLRTRSGLGKGSACLGIPAAQGRPTTREAVEEGGSRVERLRYESAGVVATFLCIDGRLAEMTIAAVER